MISKYPLEFTIRGARENSGILSARKRTNFYPNRLESKKIDEFFCRARVRVMATHHIENLANSQIWRNVAILCRVSGKLARSAAVWSLAEYGYFARVNTR